MIISTRDHAGATARAIAPPERPRRRTPDLAAIGVPARQAIEAGDIPSAVIGVSDAWGTLQGDTAAARRYRDVLDLLCGTEERCCGTAPALRVK